MVFSFSLRLSPSVFITRPTQNTLSHSNPVLHLSDIPLLTVFSPHLLFLILTQVHHLVRADEILALSADGSVMAYGALKDLLERHPTLLQEAGIQPGSDAAAAAQAAEDEAASSPAATEEPATATSALSDSKEDAAAQATADGEVASMTDETATAAEKVRWQT